MHLEISTGKWRSFCLALNVLISPSRTDMMTWKTYETGVSGWNASYNQIRFFIIRKMSPKSSLQPPEQYFSVHDFQHWFAFLLITFIRKIKIHYTAMKHDIHTFPTNQITYQSAGESSIQMGQINVKHCCKNRCENPWNACKIIMVVCRCFMWRKIQLASTELKNMNPGRFPTGIWKYFSRSVLNSGMKWRVANIRNTNIIKCIHNKHFA